MIQKYINSTYFKLNIGLLAILLFAMTDTKAQTFLGLQHSNMSGIHQTGLNPANIADSRHKFYVNGFTLGTGFNNDYLKLSLPFSPFDLFTKQSVRNTPIDNNWFTENLNGKPKNLNLYAQFRTPGVLYKISKGLTVALQFKNTFSFQVNDVAEPLAKLGRHGVDSVKGTALYSGPNQYSILQNYKDNRFSINVNMWGEIAGTVAKTIINTETYSLKAGITPKYLIGYATAYIKNNGIQFKLQSQDSIIFNQTDISYGYTNPTDLKNINPQSFLSEPIKSSGFGYDFGVTFEYNPKIATVVTSKKNKYLFRGGISLLDAGRITYKNPSKNLSIFNGPIDKVFVLDSSLSNAFSNGEEQGLKHADSVFRTIFAIDTSSKNIVTTMPTTLNFQFDYNLFKNFYIGANWSQDLRGKLITGIRKPSYLVIIPRFESKLVEVSFPIGLVNDYRTGRIGAFLRVGPVFVGSDNLIGQIRANNYYGADIYFGISTGIPSKKKK